jgi:hypothetical protein
MLSSLWSRIRPQADPYEEFYLRAAPADPRNLAVNRIRDAQEGSVFAVKTETHTPEVMAAHIKELGRFFGADLTAIVSAETLGLKEPVMPFAVFCLIRADHDPREAPGIGGHTAALKGAFATFQMSAIIREFGFRATRQSEDLDALAARAGLGTLVGGRLRTPQFGTKVHVADVILTDLPVATG